MTLRLQGKAKLVGRVFVASDVHQTVEGQIKNQRPENLAFWYFLACVACVMSEFQKYHSTSLVQAIFF